jgi:CRP/FNR family transcriptional regulator, cyclic AMP receptor protein
MKIAAAKDLDPRHLGIIVGCSSIVRFDAGAYIFREAQEANQFFIIRQGKVALELFAPERGVSTIQTLGVGDVLG